MQKGDKSDVALKHKVLTERGFVFVSTNHRLLPEVTMEELTSDVARSLGWVHKNISSYGGDPERIFVGGSRLRAGNQEPTGQYGPRGTANLRPAGAG